MGNSKRKSIRKSVRLRLLKSRISSKEKDVVNVVIIVIIISLTVFVKSLTSYNAKFYTKEDIKNFDIDSRTIVKIKSVAEEENIEFEKLLAMYSKDNNYFSKGSYVVEYEESKSKLIENLKFQIFAINKEDREVYKMLKSFNSDIMCLPIKKESYKDVVSINSFDANKKSFGTIFIEKQNNICNINIVSITDGVVENVMYDGENGLSVTIKSVNGNKYVYSNLSEAKVKVGNSVSYGKILGVMGNSKQVKDEMTYERCKLKLYAIHTTSKGEMYFNIYPLLVTKN